LGGRQRWWDARKPRRGGLFIANRRPLLFLFVFRRRARGRAIQDDRRRAAEEQKEEGVGLRFYKQATPDGVYLERCQDLFRRRWLRPRSLGGCLPLLRHLDLIAVAQPEVGSGAGLRAIHHPLVRLPAGRVATSDLDVVQVR
jgi:hypothetical protein